MNNEENKKEGTCPLKIAIAILLTIIIMLLLMRCEGTRHYLIGAEKEQEEKIVYVEVPGPCEETTEVETEALVETTEAPVVVVQATTEAPTKKKPQPTTEAPKPQPTTEAPKPQPTTAAPTTEVTTETTTSEGGLVTPIFFDENGNIIP